MGRKYVAKKIRNGGVKWLKSDKMGFKWKRGQQKQNLVKNAKKKL